jgi:hypothetical protein
VVDEDGIYVLLLAGDGEYVGVSFDFCGTVSGGTMTPRSTGAYVVDKVDNPIEHHDVRLHDLVTIDAEIAILVLLNF